MFVRILGDHRRRRSVDGSRRVRRMRRTPHLAAMGWDFGGAIPLEDRRLLATLSVAISPSAVAEYAGSGAATGTVLRTGTGVDLSQPMTVALSSSDTSAANVPGTVIIPADTASAMFAITPVANSITNGPRTITISASGPVNSGLAADTSFGYKGQAGPSGIPSAMAVGPDGKVVVVGSYASGQPAPNYYDFGVQRFNADGTADATFGSNGSVVTDLTGRSDQPSAAAVQSDGKVVVGGTWSDANNVIHFALVRYNIDGTLDTTFGSGGKVLDVLGSGFASEIRDLAIQPDGKIVAAGDIGFSLAVVRYNPDGTPDATFGSNGVATVAMGQYGDRGYGVALQPDGKIVLVGQSDGGNNISRIELARFTAAGALDTAFGSGGTLFTDLPGGYDGAFDVASQPDGKIVVAGQVSKYPQSNADLDAVLIRYNADGTQDQTFGSGGVVVADLGGPADGYNGVTIDPDGSIIATGVGGTGKSAVVARYHSDGTLDATTYVTLTTGASQAGTGKAVAVQPGGRVLVLGDWGGNAVGGFVQADHLGSTTLSGSAALTVTATGDRPPVAAGAAYSTGGASSLSIAAPGVLANDTDPDKDAMTAVLVAGPAHGTVALNADGSFTYTPGADFSGSDSFTYEASDGQLNSNVATVRIAASALGSIRGTLWDDVNGDGVLGAGDRGLAGRTVYLDQNQNGLLDPGEAATTTAADGSYALTGLAPGTYDVAEVLPTGWTQTSSAGERAVLVGIATSTTFDFNELASTADQNIGPYHKAGYTFDTSVNLSTKFTIWGSGDSARYSGSPALTANPWPATISLTRDDGGPFTLTSIDLAETWKSIYDPTVTFHGTKVDGSTVTQSFTLDNIFPGFQTFTFTGFDGVTAVTWYTHDEYDAHQFDNVKVLSTSQSDITGVNFGSTGPAGSVPVASADAYTTPEGAALTQAAPGVLGNDSDPNQLPLTAALIAGPSHGQLALNADGSFTYTPASGFFGTDSFTYQAGDGQGYSKLATVNLTVLSPPVAGDDSYQAQEDAPLTVSGLGLSSGPLLRYLFDEATSSTAPAVDTGTAPAADGTFAGAATRTVDTPGSGSTGALDLSAGLGYVSAGSVSKLQNLTALTLTAWIDLRSVPADQSVLMSENGPSEPVGGGSWELRITRPSSNSNPLSASNFGLAFYVYQNQGTYSNGQSSASAAINAADRWVFVAVTFDANRVLNYYVGDPANSVAGAGSSTYSYALGANTAPFMIGATSSFSTNRTPPAWVDDVRVYGSALSSGQLDGIRREDLGRGVLANDSDPQGLPLTSAIVAGPAHGSVTLNGNGSFTYTPTAGYLGTDSFTYRTSNGTLTSNTATVSLTVGQPPVAGDDAYSTAMNAALTVSAPGVLGNDSNPSTRALTAALVAGPSHGQLALNGDGSFTYTPASGFFGIDSFTYQASNGTLTSNTATVSLTVGAAPTAAGDSYSTTENTGLTIAAPGVLANDTDPNDAPMTAVVAVGPAHGTLTLNADGSFTYSPAANYSGTDSFTYQAGDGQFLSSPATVTLTVIQPPWAGNDAYSAAPNTALSIAAPGVLGNDSDPNQLPLTAALVAGPSHGQLALNADGSFTYTPASGFFGTDSFTYQAGDGQSVSNVATVSLTVGQPVAGNDAYSTTMNAALTIAAPGVLGNDSDPSGQPLTAALLAGPSHGQLTFNADGSFTYTPASGFFGTDRFTYQASDGPLASSPATVTLTVVDQPTARDDAYAYAPGSPLSTAAAAQTYVTMSSQKGDWVGQGQTYAFTPANSTITAHLLTDGPIVSGVEVDVTTPSQSWTLDFAAPSPGYLVPGTYTGAARWPFEPAGAPGLDVSGDGRGSNTISGQFTVSQAVYDTSNHLLAFGASFTQYGDGSTAALTGQVAFQFTNNRPVGVLVNDSDASPSATLTAVLVGNPSHGTVALNANGSFTFTPAAGYSGTDSFTYKASNGQFGSNVATVTLTADHPPAAQDDAYTLGANSPLTAGVGGTFLTMGSQPGDWVGQGQPYFFTPSSSTITATASGNSVHVQVTAPGHNWTLDFAAPNAGRLVPGFYPGAMRWGFQSAGAPGLDVSGDGRGSNTISGQFTVTQASYDTSGNLIAFAARFVQYGDGSTSALTGQVAFNSASTPPGGLLANDSDSDAGTTLVATLVSNPAHGTLVLNPDGSFAYSPAAGFTGTDSFTYKASDGVFGSNPSTVTLTVLPPPVANADSYIAAANTPLAVAGPGVLANDTDSSLNPMIAALVAGPAHGTLTLNADGSFAYTPATGFSGVDTFTYAAGDGIAFSSPATVTITVAPPAQATPIRSDTAAEGNWNGTYGAQGYDVINGPTSLPSYATVAPSGQSSWTWQSSTTDPRALQTTGGDRVAACWYSATSFSVDVNLTDGQAHDLALYLLDWDKMGRTEMVQISDANSGAVLSTQTASSFGSGVYLDYQVSGHIRITFTNGSGSWNAVLSGLFLDPTTPPPATATFVKQDATTQGAWSGTYGSQGYDVINGPASLPSYATVAPSGQSSWTWQSSTTDPRALQTTGGDRVAACWYSATSFSVDVNLTDGQAHDLALYLLDWDNLGRSETVQISDPSTGSVLSTQSAASFSGGVYLDYQVSGHIRITITNTGPQNAVLGGLFLDPTTPPPPAAATFVKQDATTQGAWSGTYGNQGYEVIGGSTSLPSYATVAPSGQSSWTWQSPTTDPRALQTASGSSARTAATWYSTTSFAVDVSLTDGQAHDLGLYLLDWDDLGRSETVQISDANSGAVLSTQTASSFGSGVYLDYQVSGHIRITFTNGSGSRNAVLSGLFLDPTN